MISPDETIRLLSDYGLWIMAPVAVVEGPIVTVLAAWLASLGHLSLPAVIATAILADLAGDLLLYTVGRCLLPVLPRRFRARVGLRRERLDRLAGHFDTRGASTLLVGKLTHSVGAAVLVSAGMARMPLWPFLGWNLVATVPKSLLFVALGWTIGGAHARIGAWLSTGSVVMVATTLAVGAAVILWRRRAMA